MSTANIRSIEPVIVEDVPIGVKVTFQTKKGTRTYLYNGASIAVSILRGEDPVRYAGILIDSNEV